MPWPYRMKEVAKKIVILILILQPSLTAYADEAVSIDEYRLAAGDPSLAVWLLPEPEYPSDNLPSAARIALGKKLFFDPRLSGAGDVSCGSCHNPQLGWSDGLPTAIGVNGKKLKRATPTIINSAFNHLQMWDGRFDDLESQVAGPLTNPDEMNMAPAQLVAWLEKDEAYGREFARAYPSQPINMITLSKAIAAFERTVISSNSPFDHWVRGDNAAMTNAQIKGFEVFLDADKGNCVACHAPPNFSDDGYHNIGLNPHSESPDNGRFDLVPVRLMRGAFRTPTLRDIGSTRPYFHDGSASTLRDVMDHYAEVVGKVGDAEIMVSPTLKETNLTPQERENLLLFLTALGSCSSNGSSLNQFSGCSAQTAQTERFTR